MINNSGSKGRPNRKETSINNDVVGESADAFRSLSFFLFSAASQWKRVVTRCGASTKKASRSLRSQIIEGSRKTQSTSQLKSRAWSRLGERWTNSSSLSRVEVLLKINRGISTIKSPISVVESEQKAFKLRAETAPGWGTAEHQETLKWHRNRRREKGLWHVTRTGSPKEAKQRTAACQQSEWIGVLTRASRQRRKCKRRMKWRKGTEEESRQRKRVMRWSSKRTTRQRTLRFSGEWERSRY